MQELEIGKNHLKLFSIILDPASNREVHLMFSSFFQILVGAEIIEIVHENSLFVAVKRANVSQIQEIAGWGSAKVIEIVQEEHTAAGQTHQNPASVTVMERIVSSLLKHVSLTKKHYRQGKANVIFSFTKPCEKKEKKRFLAPKLFVNQTIRYLSFIEKLWMTN